jgi:copper chaperone NosL
MTVIDQQHASQLVTKKGKVFKFDSIECMMYHLKNVEAADLELYRVNDYDQPGELIDATRAIYLISEGIPSPMGENLSAFRYGENAEKAQEDHGGNLFIWQELQNHFKNKQV